MREGKAGCLEGWGLSIILSGNTADIKPLHDIRLKSKKHEDGISY